MMFNSRLESYQKPFFDAMLGAGSTTYKPSALRRHDRPDPENVQQGFHAPDYGRLSKGFAITDRWELAAPPFVATKANNTPADNARLFAVLNVAMADASILAWDQKYCHDFWRPVAGIREHDKSMGPGATQASSSMDTDCDPLWSPLGAPNSNRITKNFTPPFPASPSGHATFGAAAFHITRLFYGQGGRYDEQTLGEDDLFDGLDFVSDELNGITTDNTGAPRPRHRRRFPDGLWRMIEENGRSRVYLGVLWVFDAFVVDANDDADLYRMKDRVRVRHRVRRGPRLKRSRARSCAKCVTRF